MICSAVALPTTFSDVDVAGSAARALAAVPESVRGVLGVDATSEEGVFRQITAKVDWCVARRRWLRFARHATARDEFHLRIKQQ